MSPNLETAIDRLYSTFRGARPRTIDGCPCCISQEERCTLVQTERRTLSADDLSSYASSVFLTCGSQLDFRYFLPRVFEIAATNEDWWPSPEIVIERLNRADWRSWTPRERRAVREFLLAWLDDRASENAKGLLAHDRAVDAIICGVALAGEDLTPYLEQVFRHREGLAALYEVNETSIADRGRLINPFWDADRQASQAVIDFLLSPRVQGRIADAE